MVKKKTDFSKIMKQYEPVVRKAGEQISNAMKAAEKDISKMYRVAETHIEIQMKNLQKEKLYYDIGKEVAGKIDKGGITDADLDKYRKKLKKIDSEAAKKKRQLTRAGKQSAKKKKTVRKK
ncbi:MAG: hypothetical protein GF409_03400 [Candidatus Omnitrophica bacterium]|nr:hypothetical protein [Candidatus Omnitrophota bacterium]